jgi:hypothetical protein
MKPIPVSSMDLPNNASSTASVPSQDVGQSFDKVLETATLENSLPPPGLPCRSETSAGPLPAPPALLMSESPDNAAQPRATDVAAAYQKHLKPAIESAPMSDVQKYKDDQLLRNPGGRRYYLDRKEVVENPQDQESLLGRVKKDVSDTFGNIKNFFGNMFSGTTVLHRNDKNEIQEGHQRGLAGTVKDFVKDLGSALTFGSWHPDTSEAPKGFKNRLVYSASKLKDAFVGDILEGIPSSINHMGKNLVLAGWHLMEVVPDATLANFGAGQKLVTNIFDNGHVAIEYLTDVVPSGDAWLRVHASSLKELKPPVLYNIKMPEHFTGDTRWENVRNTPFRKSIETIGALLADAAAIGFIGQTGISSDRHNQIK